MAVERLDVVLFPAWPAIPARMLSGNVASVSRRPLGHRLVNRLRHCRTQIQPPGMRLPETGTGCRILHGVRECDQLLSSL